MEIFLRIHEWSRFAETDFFKTSGENSVGEDI